MRVKGLLDGLLVTAAIVASIGYVLYALGPRALRKRIAAALGRGSGRTAAGGACGGGCGNCGSAGAAEAGAAEAAAAEAGAAEADAAAAGAAKAGAAPTRVREATEVHVPLSKIGKRRQAGSH